jgi:hypothetical protein
VYHRAASFGYQTSGDSIFFFGRVETKKAPKNPPSQSFLMPFRHSQTLKISPIHAFAKPLPQALPLFVRIDYRQSQKTLARTKPDNRKSAAGARL